MAFFIEKKPRDSLAELLGGGIGAGVQTGLAQKASLSEKISFEQEKQKLQQDKMKQALSLYEQLSGGAATSPEQRDVGFEGVMKSQAAGREDQYPSAQAVAAMSLIDPNLGKAMSAERKEGLRRTATDRKLAYDETRDVRKEYASKSKKAKDFDLRLDRMDELVNEGKLINPVWNAMLEKFGYDIPALKNPQSQEFDKLVSDLTRDIRARFGARITNFELKIFLKSIPGLSQTDEGKRRVVHNLRLLNKADIVRNTSKTKIIRANNGVPPIDLEDKVEELAGPELDKISEQFKSGIEGKTAPETAPTGRPLTRESAMKFLNQAGGDKEKARELAKKAGFQF